MGYRVPRKSSRGAVRYYRKPLRGKALDKELASRSALDEKCVVTEKEVTEATLRRLHILGSQKFGSSPFSMHFDRWLANVEAVIFEFESYPNMNIDTQFVRERTQTVEAIWAQLEDRRRKEAVVDEEIKMLFACKSLLKNIDKEYVFESKNLKHQKNNKLKGLNINIEKLKKEQDRVIKLKTGFLRGLSREEREQKEIQITQELNGKQLELELVMLHYNAKLKDIHDRHQTRRHPLVEQVKALQKSIRSMESDGSLEERWLACEILIDAINTFLQRKGFTKIQ